MVGPCVAPYTHPPECNVTWATSSHQVYITTQILWIIASVVMWFICLIQLIRLAQNRGWSWNLWYTGTQHQIHAICFLSTTSLVIRARDPMGWGDHLYNTNMILQGFGSCCALAVLTLAVTTWAKIIATISGGSQQLILLFERCSILSNFILLMICFGLKVGAHPTWLFSVISLIFVATYIFVTVGFGWFYGYQIHHHLRAFDQQTRMQQRRATNPPPLNAPVSKVNSSNRRQVSIILKLLTAITIVMIFAIYFEISTAITSFRTRFDDRDAPEDPPAMTWGGMFNSAALTIAQGLAIPIALYAFKNVSPVRSPSNNPPSFVELGKTTQLVDGQGNKPISVERGGSGVGGSGVGARGGRSQHDAPVSSPPITGRTTSTTSCNSKSNMCHVNEVVLVVGDPGDGVEAAAELPVLSPALTSRISSTTSVYEVQLHAESDYDGGGSPIISRRSPAIAPAIAAYTPSTPATPATPATAPAISPISINRSIHVNFFSLRSNST